jgi:hypothetical protein
MGKSSEDARKASAAKSDRALVTLLDWGTRSLRRRRAHIEVPSSAEVRNRDGRDLSAVRLEEVPASESIPLCLDPSTAVGLPQSSRWAGIDKGSKSSCVVRKAEGEDLWTSWQSSAEETLEGRTGGEKAFGEVQLDMTPAGLNGFKRS